jgi:hypothetical protein
MGVLYTSLSTFVFLYKSCILTFCPQQQTSCILAAFILCLFIKIFGQALDKAAEKSLCDDIRVFNHIRRDSVQTFYYNKKGMRLEVIIHVEFKSSSS